jgi:hypothetical protein
MPYVIMVLGKEIVVRDKRAMSRHKAGHKAGLLIINKREDYVWKRN